jgi:mRNA interferase RelE/StbE
MSYEVNIKKSAQKSLAKISQPYKIRIIESIRNLSDQPRQPGCKKLSARDAWRIRVSDYRIIYEIDDKELIILVVHIGHRNEVYKMKS